MAVALTALSLVFLLLLLVAEVQSSRRLRYLAKPLASASFVVLGVVLGDWGGPGQNYSLCIAIGLLLGAIGDVALMFRSQRSFLLVPPLSWVTAAALGPVAVAAAMLVYLWPHLGKLRVAVLFYVATIVLMVMGALAVYQNHGHGLSVQQASLLLAGAMLFFLSDVAVAKSRFVKAQLVDRLWGLPAYYAGQHLIAWSLLT